MNDNFYVTKVSGEKELFSKEKYLRSLKRSGCPEDALDLVFKEVVSNFENGITTKEIYSRTWNFLKDKCSSCVAGRYNLKQALLKLGPSGYPFEHFVKSLFQKIGYKVKSQQIVKGHCINYEIDVIAFNDKEKILIECKFHNNQEYHSDAKTALYVKARFDDINQYYKEHDRANVFTKCLIITNTKFTTNAIDYGECVGMEMISWGYPKENSLEYLIGKYHLHPISCLAKITDKELIALINYGIILCEDLSINKEKLNNTGLSKARLDFLINECDAL